MTATLLDCTMRFHRFYGLSDYRYSATFRIDGQDLRVRLRLDDHREIYFAIAEVLTGLDWHRLLRAEPPSLETGESNLAGAMEDFAREFLHEARAVLAETEVVA